MNLTDAAAAISGAAKSFADDAAALADAAAKLGALNDTTVLDQPVADLNAAAGAMTDAVAKVTALVPA